MRIFLAGATGAIGRLLVPLLLADGHEVTALTRRASAELRGVTTVVGDVYDGLSLRQVVAAARPDVVMHQLTETSRSAWARGASDAHARTHLAWAPTYPTWRTGFSGQQ